MVNASKTYFTADDKEGSTLSCSFARRQDDNRSRLSWFKNSILVATADSSSLYINTKDIADFVNIYGTYICKANNAQQNTKSLHIAEKGIGYSIYRALLT